MASSAIFLTIIIPTIIASTSGFKIGTPQTTKPEIFSISPSPASAADYRNQPIAGYPKVPPPNAQESGGNEDDLLPPFENAKSEYNNPPTQFFKRSIENVKVDPKTGYPLQAEISWKYAGGNEEILELPFEDSLKTSELQVAVDPKTGYPLLAQPHWKDAGGDEEIIELPFEDTEENFGQKEEAVDPKTGYPLKANPSWKDAGGNEEILEPPFENLSERSDKDAVDPKTGYPLVAQESWKDAGGNEEILELPLEKFEKEAVDPKTGYPLTAQPSWKYAGGDGDILEPPLEDTNKNTDTVPVDPKTGYPLTADPTWKDSGGNGDILQLPLENTKESTQVQVDPKTGYPLIAQPSWKDAGGNGDFLQAPFQKSDKESSQKAVDPKTGYPLIAQPEWKDAGGNEDVLELPFEQEDDFQAGQLQGRSLGEYHVYEIFKLTELQPPPLEKNFPTVYSNSFSTPSPFTGKQSISNVSPSNIQNQKRNSLENFTRGTKPIESTYTYTGPENVVVTVTRFLSTDTDRNQNYQSNRQQTTFAQNNFNRKEQFGSSYPERPNLKNNFQRTSNFHGNNGDAFDPDEEQNHPDGNLKIEPTRFPKAKQLKSKCLLRPCRKVQSVVQKGGVLKFQNQIGL